MKSINKGKFYFSLILFSLLGQVAWVVENMYFNVFISEEFSASATDVALMVSLSAIVATLTTLLVGALSDKVGKRKLFIWLGYIAWGLSICAFALFSIENLTKIAGSTAAACSLGIGLTIGGDCLMTLFGSSANDAAFNAWLTDSSDNTNRGKIEGINSMMPLIAILIVFGALSSFAKTGSWWILYLIIGCLTIIAGIVGIFSIQESVVTVDKNEHYFKRIIYGFKPSSVKKNKVLYLTYLAFAIFGVAIQIFMTYLIAYLKVYIPGTTLGFDTYVLVMAPAIIAAAIATFFYGRLYDKIHFKKAIIPSLSILLIGLILLSFSFLTNNIILIFIGMLFLLSGYLCSSAVFNAKIRDLTPIDKVGSFQGIKMFAQVLFPMLIGPWIGAASISGNFSYNIENVLVPDSYAYTPNPAIFVASAIVIALVFLCLIFLFISDESCEFVHKKGKSKVLEETNEKAPTTNFENK
jgi:MFS family permease